MKKYHNAIVPVVFILPLLFFFIGSNFNRAKYINDPNYIYLMNALCICKGKSVGNIDNPGTTVMQVAAATIAGTHLVSNPEKQPLTDHVIKDPEKFVEATRLIFTLLNSVVLALLGWVVFRKSKSLWAALLVQVTTLLSSNTLDYVWTKLSPEPLLFFITCAFTILIFYFYYEEDKTRWKYVWLFSLVTGAGLATKATFLPLVVFPLFVLPSFKRKMFYLLGTVPAFVLFTIPAITEYKALYYWFRNMFCHSGMYGNGAKQIIDPDTYLPNIIHIIDNNLIIGYILAAGILSLLIFILKKRNFKNRETGFLSGLIATFIFGVLLVAKHYKADHYLIPILLLSGVTIFMVIQIINETFKLKILQKLLLPLTALGFLIFTASVQPRKMEQINLDYKKASEEISSSYQLIKDEYPDYMPVNYYIFSMNKFTALKFGDDFSKARIRNDLKRIYPNTYFYEFSSNQYFKWNEKIELQDIIKQHGKKIILLNGPTDEKTLGEMKERGFPVKQVYHGSSQNLFILDIAEYDE